MSQPEDFAAGRAPADTTDTQLAPQRGSQRAGGGSLSERGAPSEGAVGSVEARTGSGGYPTDHEAPGGAQRTCRVPEAIRRLIPDERIEAGLAEILAVVDPDHYQLAADGHFRERDEDEDEPDDLTRFLAEEMRDPAFIRAWTVAQIKGEDAAYQRGIAEGRRQEQQFREITGKDRR